jgi:hypothetical protein
MSKLARRAMYVAVFVFGCGGDGADGPPARRVSVKTQADTVVSCDPQHPECTITSNDDLTLFRIDKPIIDREHFDYPSIQFAPGDRITFEADGCTQTGGFGDTWHDYVAPLDDPFIGAIHPDALHWGAFSVPGVQPETQFRDIMQGEPMGPEPMRSVAPLIVTTASHLVLHFKDDDYDGNGYSDHDDGEGDQCSANNGNDGGPAHVIVHIEHGPVPPPHDPTTDWDLFGNLTPGEPEQFDANGFRIAARWGWQVLGQLPAPTTFDDILSRNSHHQQITLDNISATKVVLNTLWSRASFGFGTPMCDSDKGHLNWDEVTVRGKVYWNDHATSDDDWNIQISSPQIEGTQLLAGTTLGNSRDNGRSQPFKLILGEFDSDEVVDEDAFNQISWWRDLHTAVDADDGLKYLHLPANHAAEQISGHDAVMTGLLGLDTVHPPWGSELHPVHILAIRMNATSDLDDDGWAFFFRNFGNEGFCGSKQHYIDSTRLTLTILRPPGASTAMPRIRSLSVAAHRTTPEIDFQEAAEGVALTATLANPGDESLVVGEVHLQWEPGDAPVAPSDAAGRLLATDAEDGEHSDADELGTGFGDLLAQATPDQARRIAELTKARQGVRDHAFTTSSAIHIVPGMFSPGPAPATFSQPTDHNDVRFAALLRSYCDVTGGQSDDTSSQLCGAMSKHFGQSCTDDVECPPTGRCQTGRCEAWVKGIWEAKHPAHDPGAPFHPLGAYVPTLGGIVVYGGITNPGPDWDPGMLDAVWTWDGVDFTLVPSNSGPGGGGGALAYDPVHDALWGHSQALSFYGPSLLWRFDVGARTWSAVVVDGDQPLRLDYGTMVFSPAAASVLAFGGGACYGTLHPTVCGLPGAQGVWTWDGARWTQAGLVGAPPTLAGPAVGFDDSRRQLVVFGGALSDVELSNRTFVYANDSWTELAPVHVPPARTGGRMAYDPARKRIILYGGRGRQNGNEVILSDTWEWDGQDWQLTNTNGLVFSAYMPVMTHDPVRHRTLAYGYFGVAEYYTLGNNCSNDSECGSSHCVDGVCCSTGSCSPGEACNTDENVGVCSPADYFMPPP